ncbi:ferritin-like domain-containing protein [Xanthomonas sp. XNM01]|uniref:ferritin-like domain-containing protein n=1 Tax=Xanthomonas sp. XNM01 TaxID=2769289 RepID=UPI00177DEA44|nr:ferritin-like domain-containing protein [Xanthomonas sp. XNM01]MBD9370697.1 ferritin-like domain-containing protein [Xanthomonas sp. XNM01]
MTTRTPDERLLMWLQDAYAMEQEAETMLTAMAGRIEHYPELRSRIEAHVEETRGQSERLKECIRTLDGSVPVARGMIADVMAGMHAAGNALMSDEVAKGLGIGYAFEHMEIASYRALVIAAREAGRNDIAEVCDAILREEIAMAEWLIEHQENVVLRFLERESTEGETAKR